MLQLLAKVMAIGAVMLLAWPVEARPLTLAHSTWVGYGPFYIAKDQGYFAEEGVEIELVIMEDTPMKMGALMAGQIDIVASTADEFPIYMKPDMGVRYILAVDTSTGGDGIVALNEIGSVADLKGKRVAFEEGSVSQFFLNVLLKQAGLSQADVQAINMTATDAGTAFAAQQVDAAVTWEPALSQGAGSDHGHLLISTADEPNLIVDVVAVTPATAEAHQDELRAFVRAWYRALDFLAENPEEAHQIMARGVGGWLDDPAVFAETLEGIQYLDEAKNKALFGTGPEEPSELYDVLGFALEIWNEFGRVQVEVTPEDIIDHRFIGG